MGTLDHLAAPPAPEPAPEPENTPTTPAPADAGTPEVESPSGEKIPYSRFRQIAEDRQQLKQRVQELEQAEAERQRAAMSEQERMRTDLTAAEQCVTDLEQRAVLAERSMTAWKIAHRTGFRHPDDAVTFLRDQLPGLDGDQLEQAVKDLADRRPDLVEAGDRQQPAGFGQTTPPPVPQVPVGPDGQPDHRAALGADLFRQLIGR